jgi:hypothetical protein
MTTDTIGSTANHGSGYLGSVYANKIVASANGNLDSLGIDTYSAAGNVRLALYSHNAAGNKPANLLAETSSGAAANGWQDKVPGATTAIVTGTTYWIAFQCSSSSNNLYYLISGRRSNYTKTYGAFDPTWSASSSESDSESVQHLRMIYSTATEVQVSDSGAGAEASGIGVDIAMSDDGSASETGIQIGLLTTDSGLGLEAAVDVAATLSLTESGTGADMIALSHSLTVTDASGLALDVLAVQSEIPIIDSGYTIEVLTVNVSFTITDTGSSADAPNVTAYMTSTDSGSGLETQFGGSTTYLIISDASIFCVETVSTPGTLIITDAGIFAEFSWRTKPSSPMIDALALPHVLSIKISDPVTMSDKKVQGGSLPRRTMVGKPGRTVEVDGWSDSQAEIDALDALRDGVRRTFYHPNGDSFGVLVTDFQPSRTADQYDGRTYRLALAEAN